MHADGDEPAARPLRGKVLSLGGVCEDDAHYEGRLDERLTQPPDLASDANAT